MQSSATERQACLHLVCNPLKAEELRRCVNLLSEDSALVLLPSAAAQLAEFQETIDGARIFLVSDSENPSSSHPNEPTVAYISYSQLVDLTIVYPAVRSW